MKAPLYEFAFKPAQLAYLTFNITFAEQEAGTNYKLEKFASEHDMFNNINPVVAYDSTSHPLSVPASTGVYRLTLTKPGDNPTPATDSIVVV